MQPGFECHSSGFKISVLNHGAVLPLTKRTEQILKTVVEGIRIVMPSSLTSSAPARVPQPSSFEIKF